MDIFEKGSWPGTGILLFVFSLVTIMVCCLSGLFIDPSMDMETRAGIIASWGVLTIFEFLFVIIARHG